MSDSGPEAPALSVCIVNYEGADVLERTLEGVRALRPPVGQVIVVDNASTDGSAELAERAPDIELVRLPENRGPGAARNAGWRRARHDLVLFLDNDAVPEPACAGRLAAELRTAGATLAMPRVLHAHDPTTIQYDGARAHFIGLLRFESAGRPIRGATDDPPPGAPERGPSGSSEGPAASEPPREIQSIVGACFLLDRRRWGAEPPCDERFFYQLEDHDLGLRARIAGHRILSVPEARCLHGSGAPGLSLRRIGRYTEVRVANMVRNRWMILLKNYRLRTLLLLSPVLLAFEGFQLAGAVRKGWLRIWLSAAGWLARRLPRLLRARRAVQRSRAVRDGEILSGGPLPFTDRLLEGRLERAARRWLEEAADAWWRIVRGRL